MTIRAARRSFVLVAAAAVLAMSLPAGSPGSALAPARAAGPAYPTLGSTFGGVYPPTGMAANAGIVDLVSEVDPPTPASVVGEAGPGPLQTTAILRADLQGSPLAGTTLLSLHLENLPIELPLSTIPIARTSAPHTWPELLDGTTLDGIPLQAVTWKQVKALTPAPAGLGSISMADVDWSNSALADLPLAAFTFGGADITTIQIPLMAGEPASHTTPAQRWCYLLNQLKSGSCTTPASLTGQSLIGISVRGAPLKNIPLKNIPLKNIDLSTSPLKNIPLKNIVLDVAPLKNIPLKNIDLQASPLKNIPLKNIDLATSPLKNIPLKNIAWATSPLKNIPLKNIDLATSPLKNIPLKNIDFGVAPLKNIPLKNITLATSPLKNIPLKNIDFGVAPLKNIPLKNIDLATSPLKNIPLKNIASVGAPLKNIPLKNIAWASAPLKNIPLKNIDLNAAGVGQFPLAALNWGAIPLRSRLAADFDTGGSPFAVAPAAGATLGEVAAANGFTAGATVADLGAALLGADITLADLRLDIALPGAPAITLEQLLAALLPAAGEPTIESLAPGTATGDPTLGDLRLDLLTDTGVTVADLLSILSLTQPDVLVGDLRIDRMAIPPELTLADFILSLTVATSDAVLLGDLRLDLATGIDALVLDALIAFLLVPTTFDAYLLGALTTYTDVTGHDITLGELGTWKTGSGVGVEITLGELAQYLDATVTLADVLLGLVPPSDFPYENFPISSLGLSEGREVFRDQEGQGGDASLIRENVQTNEDNIQVVSGADPTDPVKVHILLPPGSTFHFLGGGDLQGALLSDKQLSTDPDGRERATVTFPALPANHTGGIHLNWTPGIVLGYGEMTVAITKLDGTPLSQQSYFIPETEDGAEPNSTGDGGFYARRMPTLPANAGSDPYIDALATGFISTDTDIDWYELPNVAAGSRITADLTNLPVDADLVLYGPAGLDVSPTLFPSNAQGLPGALVEDPGLGVGSVSSSLAAQALADLRLDQGWLDLTQIVQGEPRVVPPMTPLSISQHRSSDAESVGVIAPVTGDYVVAVSGYNGDTSANPYLLRARVTSPPAALTCAPRVFTPAAPAPGPQVTIPDASTNITSLILTAPSRLVATHGAPAAAGIDTAIADLLSWLTAHPSGIDTAVVPLDTFTAVDAAYDAWDANPCSVTAANAVVRAITGVLADIQADHDELAYITIVGGDDIVPMARVVDLTRISNEAEYATTFGDDSNPISASQAGGYTLTDDAFGDPAPVDIGNGSHLFVPRIAVGRLVETPDEIVGQLAAFGANGGVLDTGTGLVAGYDFLADGARAVADRLEAPGRTVDDTLIDGYADTDKWDGADLIGAMFPSGAADPLIASINAHYDHNALQPSADGSGLVTAEGLVGAGAGALPADANRLAGRLLFTMGCHAGLAVPAAYVPGTGAAADDLRLDWAETLSAAGVAVYVANTGFGIGDTVSIAYSERLMGLYARLLDGSLTAGQALAYAKQAYYGSLGAVGVYDTKILQQTTFYGLPFWGISTTSGSGRYGAAGSTSATVIPPSLPGPIVPDGAAGSILSFLDHTVSPTFAERDGGDRGTYWAVTHPTTGDEPPLAIHNRPTQPQTVLSAGTTGLTAHGVLIMALDSHDETTVDPVLSAPSADRAAAAPEIHADDASWPARMALVSTFQSPTGQAQDLVVVPGQFLGASDGTGVQRLFDDVGVRVIYAPTTVDDFTAPAVRRGKGTGTATHIDFSVVVDDQNTKGVRVGYRDFDGTWTFKDLAFAGQVFGAAGGYSWTGSSSTSRTFGASDTIPWFAQAYDHAGNVGTGSGKSLGFLATAPDTTPPTLTFAISPAPNAAGIVPATLATVTFTCTDAGSGIAPGDCPAPELVTTQGKTLVHGHVSDHAGNEAIAVATVILDAAGPAISAEVVPAGWANASSATVTFTCTPGSSPLAAPGCPAPVVVTAQGTTQITRSVTDGLGRTASASGTVQLDRTAPTITAQVDPVANAAGWHRAATVTVTFTCGDALSGIPAGTCPAPVEISADGIHALSRSVQDVAGNGATVNVTVYRDRTAPSISAPVTPPANAAGWHRTNVTVTFSCTDALSGIPNGACPPPVELTTDGIHEVNRSVQDGAGNTASTSVTVKLDKTNPVVTFAGAPGTVKTCATTDALSGVLTPATGSNATVRVNGIPTTTLTCSGATDVAGNVTPTSSTTYVAPIAFVGFQSPVDNLPVVNNGNAGRTYPLKFTLTGIDGQPIAVLPAVPSTTFKVAGSCGGVGDALEVELAGESELKLVGTTFHYNWKTPKQKGCYEFRLGLADGTVKTALFNLR